MQWVILIGQVKHFKVRLLTSDLQITVSICQENHYKIHTKQHTSFVAHWKPATTESFISLRYCTPLVQSIRRFGPVPSGPKHQILRASLASYEYLSTRKRARCLGSCLGVMSPCICVCVCTCVNKMTNQNFIALHILVTTLLQFSLLLALSFIFLPCQYPQQVHQGMVQPS